ncbi:MAG TPA: hypothetical protein VGC26_06935 [Afipia sp.]
MDIAFSVNGRAIVAAILKLVTLGSVITGAIAIYTALLTNNRRLAAQIFLAYTERIFNVRRALPAESYLMRLNPERQMTAEERRAVHEAFYLCFEFHALRQHGYIAANIWRIYEPDMEKLLRSPAFDSEWEVLRQEFEAHSEFIAWVSEKRHAGLPRKDFLNSPSIL